MPTKWFLSQPKIIHPQKSQLGSNTKCWSNLVKRFKKLVLLGTGRYTQGQNCVGVLGPSDDTFKHCKAVTTLRSGKVIDKTI